MLNRTSKHWWGVVLDAPDANELARFYARLLDWPIVTSEPNYAVITPGDGVSSIGFQTSTGYEPPTWPNADGRQQQMLHLDLEVGDLAAAVTAAIEAGATLAEFQPQQKVRVMIDPAGHPFCLYVDESASPAATGE